MKRVFSMLSAGFVYFCVATVIAAMVGLAMLYQKGAFSDDRLLNMWAALHGINLSGFYRWQSGTPFHRTVAVGTGAGPVVILMERRGSRRLDSLNELDFRIEKEFRLGNFGRVDTIVDIFNVFNIDTITTVVTRNQVRRPTEYHRPRELRLAARYIW